MPSEKTQTIVNVLAGSIGEELEIEAGDVLVTINGNYIKDVFDYRYQIASEELTLLIRKPDGEEWELDIEKEEDEDLGLVFADDIMDDYSSCRNKCIFCFIDQNPPGMRETIYFKDDDTRLSFLQGNYVTLTNLKTEDVQRLIDYNMSPINISVHTTNPELRCKMLNNRFAGKVMDYMTMLYQAGLDMNGQIVLCKGYNDGVELDRTIRDLSMYVEHMKSVSVVPVGLTKHRQGLVQLQEFTKEDSIEVIKLIERWQKKMLAAFGTRFVFASDEWYLKAELPIPTVEAYEEYPQIGNGVGMVRMLNAEVDDALEQLEGDERARELSLATGVLAYPILLQQVEKINKKFPNVKVHVYEIKNDFYGEKITVAGLLTYTDLKAQLEGKILGNKLLLPNVCLRTGEEVFLDDYTVSDLSRALNINITIVESMGNTLVEDIIK